MTGKPLTTTLLADALSCFWNAALGAQQQGQTPVSCMAEGIQAIADRLLEQGASTHVPANSDEIVMAKCREVLATESPYGHSDLSDFLAGYLKGKDSLDMFLWNCNVTWLGSKSPPPQEE